MADVSSVCTIQVISRQLNPMEPGLLAKKSNQHTIILAIMCYVKKRWPHRMDSKNVLHYKSLEDSLVTEKGCLLFEARIIKADRLKNQVLQLVQLGDLGMQRMKQLACSVVYWSHIYDHIKHLCQTCTVCAEYQNKPPKPANH